MLAATAWSGATSPTVPTGCPAPRARSTCARSGTWRRLTRAGRIAEGRYVFEKMLTYANHVGLFAEEIGPAGEALGNFPQAFTHLALISAAATLDRRCRASCRHHERNRPRGRRTVPP